MRKEMIAIIILAIGLAITISFNIWFYDSNQQLNARLDTLNQSLILLNQKLDASPYPEWRQYDYTENSSLGLVFSITLNATFARSGQPIGITLSETNTLPTFNNITAGDNWNYSGFQGQLCSGTGLYNRPFTVAIIRGYFAESELSGTSSLPIFHTPTEIPMYCPFFSLPYEYDFYPSSSLAAIKSSFEPINESVTSSMSFSGYYAPSEIQNGTWTQTIINFTQGVYTIVAGDEWGQLIVLHFVVL